MSCERTAQLLRKEAKRLGHASPRELVSKSPDWRTWLADTLSPSQSEELIDSWAFNARHNQLPPPGPWRIWFLCTGRGWGKNRTAAEWVHDQADLNPSLAGFLGARTLGGAAKTIVGHPKSGLLVTQRPGNRCEYKHHLRKVIWANGAYADIHSSEEPDDARGPEYAWGFGDEIATWKRVVDFFGNTTWTNLQFGLRGGDHPQMIACTTPRPVALVRDLLARGMLDGSNVELTQGNMYDNTALPQSFLDEIEEEFQGTRIYRQEVGGEYLMDVEDAIITTEMLDASRVAVDALPDMARIVVAVDPALSHHKKSDKTGINVTGLGVDGDVYSIEDLSCRMSVDGWTRRVADAVHKHQANYVVAESNVIGKAIETLIQAHDRNIYVKTLPATEAKHLRAYPVLQKHEQGKAHIVGNQPGLEDQLVQFTPGGWKGDGSPDEADAYAWGANEFITGHETSWDDMIAINS